jgi:putative ABC transport system substrate-binding protein
MVRRRFLLTSLAGALAAPVAALAQRPGKVYRIVGVWTNPSPQMEDVLWQGLRELGWVEGQNFVFERRYAEGRNERHAAHAAELLRLQPDLIIAVGTPAALAAKEATTTIAIVFILVADPVGSGLVRSLARPGGNITGIALTGPEVLGKHVELLREAVPSLSRVGVLINSAFSFHVSARPVVEAAAQNLGLRLTYLEVRTPEDIDGAFAEISREKLDAVFPLPQPLAYTRRARLAQLALAHRVASVVGWREAVEAGALMGYSTPIVEFVRREPYYIDRILKGAKPADLPVEQPTRFELTINLKTAKTLGLTLPPSLLARADQVIE